MFTFKKAALIAALAVLIGSGVVGAAVHAQSASTMPTLYTQSGVAVNTGSGSLAPGYYYLAGGGQVQYYGNGTYYNVSLQQYGGSVHNPNGTAGGSISSTGAVWISSGSGTAMMPALYQNGVQQNGSSAHLNAGYYFLSSNPSPGVLQVQYYGNGTFYNPATGRYGGSIHNPNGTAGVSLGYSV